jgi:hypothetical protein
MTVGRLSTGVSHSRPTPPRPRADVVVNAAGLLCPGPSIDLAKAVRAAPAGQIVDRCGLSRRS